MTLLTSVCNIQFLGLNFQRYPVMWQGRLALKNDASAVQMHFVAGNKILIPSALPEMEADGTIQPIRIIQRMRLEPAQLEGVSKRMLVSKPGLKYIST